MTITNKRKRESGEQQASSSATSSSDYCESDSGAASDTDSDNSSGSAEETVNVDFEFYDPKEIDFLGLKALLQTYLDGETYACSELVDTIIKQVQAWCPCCYVHG
jgi:protein BCP1